MNLLLFYNVFVNLNFFLNFFLNVLDQRNSSRLHSLKRAAYESRQQSKEPLSTHVHVTIFISYLALLHFA